MHAPHLLLLDCVNLPLYPLNVATLKATRVTEGPEGLRKRHNFGLNLSRDEHMSVVCSFFALFVFGGLAFFISICCGSFGGLVALLLGCLVAW